MNLPTEIFGDVMVVHTPDELAQDQAASVEAYFENVERDNVVIDLDSTESLDSAGLTALLNIQELLRARNGDLKIATSNATNRKILEISRLDEHLDVFESVIDAVKSFR